MTQALRWKFASVLFGGALLVLTTCLAQASPLGEAQLRQQIVGKTLVAKRMGMTMRMTIHEDGTIGLQSPIRRGSGSWEIAGDQLCLDLPGRAPEGTRCQTFEWVGEAQLRSSSGMTFTLE